MLGKLANKHEITSAHCCAPENPSQKYEYRSIAGARAQTSGGLDLDVVLSPKRVTPNVSNFSFETKPQLRSWNEPHPDQSRLAKIRTLPFLIDGYLC